MRVVPHGAGCCEWRIEAPSFTLESLAWDLALGMLLFFLVRARQLLGAAVWHQEACGSRSDDIGRAAPLRRQLPALASSRTLNFCW